MVLVVIDPLRGPDHSGRSQQWLSGIQIAVETRKVTARDQEADPMAGLKDVAGLVQRDISSDPRAQSSPACSGNLCSVTLVPKEGRFFTRFPSATLLE